jgi:molecular chaperone DnaK (HSP70)
VKAGRDPGRHVVGIELGTTNSVVAMVDDSGTVVVFPNASHSSLGGADVDQRLFGVILERLGDQLPTGELDEITGDSAMLADLMLETDAANKTLSARTARQITVERLLHAAGLDGRHDIDDVIMVGGSTRCPHAWRRCSARRRGRPTGPGGRQRATVRAKHLAGTPQFRALTTAVAPSSGRGLAAATVWSTAPVRSSR